MTTFSPEPKPSFSPRRRWGMSLRVLVTVLLVLAVVVMANYLGREFFYRLHLGARSQNPLSPRTQTFVGALTNRVKVIIYYDRNDSLYSRVADLLGEYHRLNHRLTVQTVDYLRDPGAAAQLKYPFLASAESKNLVIFDCDGKVKPVSGDALAQYSLEPVASETDREFRRRPTSFLAEQLFTSAIIDVTSPKPLKAYFLEGHGEHSIDSGDETSGYLKFASVLRQNYIAVQRLSLLGTNTVPADCNLLVIAGPTSPLPELELARIEQYLNQGGRLLALFNCFSVNKDLGLEKVLARWGVQVSNFLVKDPENSFTGSDIAVGTFGKHAIVNPLLTLRLHLVNPRAVGRLSARTQTADAPRVEEIAFSGPKSRLASEPYSDPRPFPLLVAVEKGAVKDVITERGTTRMVVGGDSIFLANRQIDSAANRDFATFAVNWLLDRTYLLQGIGPRPIADYRLSMTRHQVRQAQWILLAAMPGSALLLGCLVWLRRRS